MMGGYTENPEKPQNCPNWEVGTYPGLYGVTHCGEGSVALIDKVLTL